jgi:hypothetical protein
VIVVSLARTEPPWPRVELFWFRGCPNHPAATVLLDVLLGERLGAALFLVPVVGIVVAIVTGDRPAPVALAGIVGVLLGLGLVSVVGASAPSAEEPARRTA